MIYVNEKMLLHNKEVINAFVSAYYQQLGEDIADIFFAGKFDVISTLFRNCERELLHLLSLDLNLLQRDEAVMILSQGTD